VDEAAQLIRNQVDDNANIIVGSALDNDLDGIVRVSVVATGVDAIVRSEDVPAPFTTTASSKVETTKVVELGVHERAQEAAEAEARKAYEDYQFDRVEEAVAVNAPPPYTAPKPYPPRIQPEAGADAEDELEIPSFLRRQNR